MDRESVRTVVRVTLAIMARIARRTRTPADDLMATILQANEERIVDVVLALSLESGGQPLTEEQVARALESVGIKV